jgi:hypothetical protein
MSRGAIIAVLLAWAAPAAALDLNASLAVAPELHTERQDSPYYVGPPTVTTNGRSSRQDLELKLQDGGLNGQAILRTQAAEGQRPEYHGIANQFYYDGELAPGLGWTAGKKVMAGGVGFGFRPLDVVQRENRRGANPPPLVGVPVLALERYTAGDAWSLAWVRPGAGPGDSDSRDPGLVLRWYRLADGDDLHAVARLSHRRGLETGIGATRVLGDEWSLYGAALYQRHGWQRRNVLANDGSLLAGADPMLEQRLAAGIKAVAGAQWTGASGWSLLLEAWYDGDAYRRNDWRQLDALTARQRALADVAPGTAIDGNVAWSSQAYLAGNLLRENLLLRLAYDEDGFKPYVEWLTTPRDRGQVLTLGASKEGNRQRIAIGLRQLGGAGDSAYARAPVKRLFWCEWRLALF